MFHRHPAVMKRPTKQPSISCDHPIEYCCRRCNRQTLRQAFQILRPGAQICDLDDPGRIESASAGPTQRIPYPAWGGLSKEKKILGHNVNSEDVRGATASPPSQPLRHPPTAAAAMSHNRPPMSTILADRLGDNPNPIRRMAGHGRLSPILPHWRHRRIPTRREPALHRLPEVLDIKGYAALRSNDLP
jgi:hypothetical protein